MRVVVLTTSYPRDVDDPSGVFVRAGVEHLHGAGLALRVVSPAEFRHFGIAYGDGIANNLRASPWKALALPAFMAEYARAARRASRGADLVHAHWIPSAVAARATGLPFVLQLWGSDAALAHRAPRLFAPLVRSAAVVIAASSALADDAAQLGARDVRLIPNGVELPQRAAAPEEPPHVLFVGRLSEEKGVRDLAEAASGLPLRVVGDGPLRELLPQAEGFIPPHQIGASYERASIVVVPSRREGYGVVAREAMAYGRPVVATRVGGLLDAVEQDVTGLLVPPQDPRTLRAALVRLLDDPGLRRRLGDEARRRAAARFGWDPVVATLRATYADALRGR